MKKTLFSGRTFVKFTSEYQMGNALPIFCINELMHKNSELTWKISCGSESSGNLKKGNAFPTFFVSMS